GHGGSLDQIFRTAELMIAGEVVHDHHVRKATRLGLEPLDTLRPSAGVAVVLEINGAFARAAQDPVGHFGVLARSPLNDSESLATTDCVERTSNRSEHRVRICLGARMSPAVRHSGADNVRNVSLE